MLAARDELYRSMKISVLDIPEIRILKPQRFVDGRGYFSEIYNKRTLSSLGIEVEFVQDNCSLSIEEGTVRGLHFQIPPFAQDKLVRVIRGKMFDVAVDLRHGSPSYGRYVSAILSAEEWNQIYIPKGFAHGFCTLEPNTEVGYRVSEYYAPEYERGVHWNDPDLGIDWPISGSEVTLAARDQTLPPLKGLSEFFTYGSSLDETACTS